MNRNPEQIFFSRHFLIILFTALLLFHYETNILSQPYSRKKVSTVVIDPGHGGKDPGAHGKFSVEKNIALHIALKLGSLIQKNLPDVKVIYTRKTDVFIPLYERAEIANKNHADLFISIHVNSSHSKLPEGTETYAMGLAKTKENLEVAKKENSVILEEDNYASKYDGYNPNSTESFIIFNLLQNTYMEQSLDFATYVQNQFKDKALRDDRGVKQAGFLVLWKTTMPSVLIETGFISNPKEEKFLNSKKGVDLIASAIFRAFRNYKHDIENHSVYVKRPDQDTTNETVDNQPDTTQSDTTLVQPSDTLAQKPEIAFFVQILSSSRRIPQNSKYFKGFTNVEEIISPHSYKYAIGRDTSYRKVLQYIGSVRKSFPGAFMIATRNGKIIPINEALKEIKD